MNYDRFEFNAFIYINMYLINYYFEVFIVVLVFIVYILHVFLGSPSFQKVHNIEN